MLPKLSFAVTVSVPNETPAVALAGPVTVRVEAAAEATVIAPVVPVIVPVTVSVAVIGAAAGLGEGGREGVRAVVAGDEGVVGGQGGAACRRR